MSVSKPLKNVIGLDLDNLQKRLSNQLSAVLETIFHLNFSDDDVSNERKVDKPYMQAVLTTFIKFPTLSYNEVQLEYHSKKKLVGGSIDVVVGSESNGNKPYIYVCPKNVSIYLGSLLEANSSSRPLAASSSASFDESSIEIKALIQPMLELMAISEVAAFPKADVPLLNIFGNKFVYRPLLYFKEYDVLLTTPRPIHLRRDVNSVDGLGLLFMFVLFQLHNTRTCSFEIEEVKKFPTSGWKAALCASRESYCHSTLFIAGVKPRMPHADTLPFLHPSDDEDGSDDGGDGSNGDEREGGKRKRAARTNPQGSKTPRMTGDECQN